MRLQPLPMREFVIRRTTIRAAALGAVNLSQGFPDDDTFPELKQFAVEAIAGCNHQYTDPWGAPLLRAQIAKKLRRFNGIDADPQRNIVVACGATEGMIVAMKALMALRLARYFGTSPELWLGLQQDYELDRARDTAAARIEKEVLPRAKGTDSLSRCPTPTRRTRPSAASLRLQGISVPD
jgi:aminotransferase class I and II